MKNTENFFDKQTAITYSLLIVVLLLDQISKQLIIDTMPLTIDIPGRSYSDAAPYEILPWFYLKHVVNFGAAFSIFYGKTYLLLLFVTTIIIAIIIYERNTYKNRPALLSAGLGLIMAGALGNYIDRLRLGYVTDFFATIYQGKLIWPIFNVADISVNTGVGLFVLGLFLLEMKAKKAATASPPPSGEAPADPE
jgi:signal peptidase II